ncbi:MAG: hypothetical protein KDB18_09785, partial [Salinibacterium sp.]|nr:hypothetical protein [Salinibacterium sp.]
VFSVGTTSVFPYIAAPVHWARRAGVPTLHETESSLCEDLLDELRRRFGSKVVPAVIRRDQALKEAASFGQPIIEYDRDTRGAQDYLALGDWILGELPTLGSGDSRVRVEHAAGQPVVCPGAGTQEGLTQRVLGRAGAQLDTMHDRAKALADKLAERARQASIATAAESPRKSDDSRRLFGARPTTSGVLFVQPLALGRRVCVVGEFNQWQPAPMRRNESLDVYELCLPLKPGEHRYRLDVDGHRLADPYNSEWQLDSEGHPNSVIRVLSHPQSTPVATTQ